MGDVRWTLRAVGFQTLVAYSMSFIIYQLGSFFSSQNFDVLSLVALLVLLVGLYFIFRKGKDVSYELS